MEEKKEKISEWNIASLGEKNREGAIKKYLEEWKRLNPTHEKDMLKGMEEDLRLLIKRKLELYPDIKKQIVNAHIQEMDGKNRITVASVTLKQIKVFDVIKVGTSRFPFPD